MNLPRRLADNSTCIWKPFECDCLQAVRRSESLYYIGVAVAVSSGFNCCSDSYIFDFHRIRKGGIKENKYIVCHTGGITRYVKEIGNKVIWGISCT